MANGVRSTQSTSDKDLLNDSIKLMKSCYWYDWYDCEFNYNIQIVLISMRWCTSGLHLYYQWNKNEWKSSLNKTKPLFFPTKWYINTYYCSISLRIAVAPTLLFAMTSVLQTSSIAISGSLHWKHILGADLDGGNRRLGPLIVVTFDNVLSNRCQGVPYKYRRFSYTYGHAHIAETHHVTNIQLSCCNRNMVLGTRTK